jgi:cytoskeletal protein RodZ
MDTSTQTEQKTTDKESKQKKWLLGLVITLLVVLLGGMGYMWWLVQEANEREDDLKKTNQMLQAEVDALKAEAAKEPAPACNNVASDAMKENIKAALDTENTQPFSTYTTEPVELVIAGTEEGGNKTPDEAAVAMDYTHTATGPWDFNLDQAILDDYNDGPYTEYFDENTYVGRSANGMVAAFNFDCDGKIKQIFLAADEDML